MKKWKVIRKIIHTLSFMFVCIMLGFQIGANLEFKERLLRTQNMYEAQFDSLVSVVTEHKPDKIFFDTYLTFQQHERMRDHQLKLFEKDIQWLEFKTGIDCSWSDGLTMDEFYEVINDPTLMVNQMQE